MWLERLSNLAPNHKGSKWQSQDLNPGHAWLTPRANILSHTSVLPLPLLFSSGCHCESYLAFCCLNFFVGKRETRIILYHWDYEIELYTGYKTFSKMLYYTYHAINHFFKLSHSRVGKNLVIAPFSHLVSSS